MSVICAMFGTGAVLAWLAAVGLRVLGWLRSCARLHQLASVLAWGGLALALASWGWDTTASWPAWAPVRALQASGLAVSAIVLMAFVARGTSVGLASLLVCAFAIVAQSWSVRAMWWGGAVDASAAMLPVWMAARDLCGMVGGGALVVRASAMVARHLVGRTCRGLAMQWDDDITGLRALECVSERVALGALTLSLSFGVARSWLGWGDVMRPDVYWLAIAWMLLAAGGGGWIPGTTSRRISSLMAVLSLLATCVAVVGPA